MQQKLCLVLALMALVGALAVGNPLHCVSAVDPTAPGPDGAGASGVDSDDPAGAPAELPAEVPLAAQPAATQPAAQRLRNPFEVALDVPKASIAAYGAEAVLRATPALAATTRTSGTTPVAAALTPCPDPALRDLVVEVRYGRDGEPIWVLQDGRLVRRNPDARAGAALVVEVDGEDEAPGPVR